MANEKLNFDVTFQVRDAVSEIAKLQRALEALKTSVDGVGGEVKKVEEELTQQEETTKKSSKSMEDLEAAFASGMSKLADFTVVARGVIDAMVSAAQAAIEFANEVNRVAGVMNSFIGNLEESRRQTSGLVSDMELIQSANRVAATGLRLTGDQLGALNARALQFSRATGEEFIATAERLADAVATGSVDALQEFGIQIGEATNLADDQRRAVNSLVEQYGDMTVSSESLAGDITQLATRFENAKNQFLAGIETSETLQSAWDELKSTTSDLANLLGYQFPSATTLAARAIAAVTTAAQQLNRVMIGVTQAVQAFQNGNYTQAFVSLGRGIQDGLSPSEISRRLQENQRNAIREMNSTAAARQTQAAIMESSHNGVISNTGGGGGGGGEQRQLYATQEAQLARAHEKEAERKAELNRLDLERTQRETDLISEMTAFRMESLDTWIDHAIERQTELHELELAKMQDVKDHAQESYEFRQGLAQQARDATVEAAAGIAQGLIGASKAERKEFLKKTALQNTFEGATETARGIAKLALPFGTGARMAATHFAAAGQHFAIAAATGIASKAIRGGGKGGGGEARPEGPSGGSAGGGKQEIVINYNAPVDIAQMGRYTRQALRAADREYSGSFR